MATKLLFIISILFSLNLSAQSTITFSYDSAGNQILRDRIVLRSSTKSIKDSVQDIMATELNDDEMNSSELLLTAYPNPVTNILKVAWVFDENDKNQQVILSSISGQQLANFKIQTQKGEQSIDFTKYATGMYLLTVVGETDIKKTFKIIKK